MTRNPSPYDGERPLHDPSPAPGLKLADLKDAVLEAAYRIDRNAETIALLTKTPREPKDEQMAKALESAAMLLDAIVAQWPKHKALIIGWRKSQ